MNVEDWKTSANSVDPDQPAPLEQSDQDLHYFAILPKLLYSILLIESLD